MAGLKHMNILAAPCCPGLLYAKRNEIANFDISHGIAPSGRPNCDAQGFRVFAPDHRTKILSRIPDDNSSHFLSCSSGDAWSEVICEP
jgi:hypothetical protein